MGLVWLRGQTATTYAATFLRPVDNRDTLRRVWRKTLILKHTEEFRQNHLFKWINGNERLQYVIYPQFQRRKFFQRFSIGYSYIFINNCMEHGPSREANSRSTDQEFCPLYWDFKFNYGGHKAF